MTILIIDDDEPTRDLLRVILAGRGMRVVTAWDAREGLGAVSRLRGELDCVITDYVMPGMDGLCLLRELRASPETRTLPVLLMSGTCIEAEALRGGASGFLSKPFFPDALFASIERVAGQGAPSPDGSRA